MWVPRSNIPHLVTTAQTEHQIVAIFATMTDVAYSVHPLRRFFEPNSGAGGYMPKRVSLPEGDTLVFEVDHILPARWGWACTAAVHAHGWR